MTRGALRLPPTSLDSNHAINPTSTFAKTIMKMKRAALRLPPSTLCACVAKPMRAIGGTSVRTPRKKRHAVRRRRSSARRMAASASHAHRAPSVPNSATQLQ